MSSRRRAAGGPVLCPSSVCEKGALLLGVVQPNGEVDFLGDRVEVDAEFVDIARQGRPPEKRFRFAGPCAKSGCSRWTGERCGVIDELEAIFPERAAEPELRPCVIRSECRWYGQNGARACAICPIVVTDNHPEGAGRPDEEPP